jgi:HK97 family phage major capsid protein
MSRTLVQTLVQRRAEKRGPIDEILANATKAERDLTAEERTQFDAIVAEIGEIDARIAELSDLVERDEAAAEVSRKYVGGTQVTREPEVYQKGPRGRSFVKDMWLARQKGDRDAHERLLRNNKMRADALDRLQTQDGQIGEQRAISTTGGAGGELVPPLWLEQEFVKFVRPGRITANLCHPSELPAGTDQINIPKILTGTATAAQAAQNTGVQQTDLTTGSVSSPVVTIAGGQTIALQLIEQSPLNIDEIVLEDLAADYAKQINLQVLSGSGTGGTMTGILTLSGTQSVAWTQATPALGGAGGLYSKLGNGVQLVHTSRFLPPTAIIMHPRRWAWAETQSDSQGRPLVVPISGGPMNVLGNLDEQASQGLVGSMLGLPVYTDPLVPINLGAGTNQDELILARMSDLWLWEGQVRAEAFQQTFAQNMSVFVRLYNYASFQAGRYPQSICGITGTGAVTPTF